MTAAMKASSSSAARREGSRGEFDGVVRGRLGILVGGAEAALVVVELVDDLEVESRVLCVDHFPGDLFAFGLVADLGLEFRLVLQPVFRDAAGSGVFRSELDLGVYEPVPDEVFASGFIIGVAAGASAANVVPATQSRAGKMRNRSMATESWGAFIEAPGGVAGKRDSSAEFRIDLA
jgi:hypothetical protein